MVVEFSCSCCLLGVIGLMLQLISVQSLPEDQPGPDSKPSEARVLDNSVKLFDGYRYWSWCVIGRNEPALARWPLVQFKTLLTKTYKIEDAANSTTKKYNLIFKQITCGTMEQGLGYRSEALHQHLHVIFNSSVEFEGVLIQGMHAPFGIGFPFGQFYGPEEFHCKCEGDFIKMSRTIPCISRPDIEILPPTVGAFHYHLLNLSAPHHNGYPVPVERQTEMHFNFKWASHIYSSVNMVEFWLAVLVVESFDRMVYDIHRFGPYDFTFNKSEILENLTQSANAQDPKRIFPPLDIPTPLFPGCLIKRVPTCDKWVSSSVCSPQWDPSPADMKINCGDDGPDYMPAKVEEYTRIRMEGEFDTECLWRYPSTHKRAGTICERWEGKFWNVAESEEAFEELTSSINHTTEGEPDQSRLYPNSFCARCPGEGAGGHGEDIDEVVIAPKKCRIGKRSCHAAVMIYAYFLLIPVSLIIGRFYKETLHSCQCAGWRTWVLLHVGIALLALIASYAGYLIPDFEKTDTHIVFGYVTLSLGALSGLGWGRHERLSILYVFFYIHTIAGYLTWVFGVVSMGTGDHIGKIATIIGCCNVGLVVFFFILMTIYVCITDHKVGMTPKRSHFPVLQVRFEDLSLPGQLFRLVALVVIVALLLITSTLMLFFDDKDD